MLDDSADFALKTRVSTITSRRRDGADRLLIKKHDGVASFQGKGEATGRGRESA